MLTCVCQSSHVSSLHVLCKSLLDGCAVASLLFWFPGLLLLVVVADACLHAVLGKPVADSSAA
jgi:hypothetical protein